ncbi:MAG: haloacid dehalogenase superfamily protein [Candidatus Aramenus sulfurataquae]|jgi:translin|uniref:Haloacid dehalogenase n=2 Tax=Candidatus Aramenus sulfurataquae TaxID=1326980 RepID=W7KPP2_9CREN|nr:MAG: haloacid dehalogenase superfamily protein [Candidatus Aramenus sulfurataquae]MCL7343074.1 haloacid dehalogenase [Candidatus Aramenus sulfurataquae]
MDVDKIIDFLNNIEPKLSARSDSREQLLLKSRELIRLCGETISLTHRQKKEEALKKFQEAVNKAREIEQIVSNYPELLYGDVGTAFQELAEASIVLSFYFDVELRLPNDLGIPDIYYITGIADAVGEMRRALLEKLRKGDGVKEAERILEYMDVIYENLWKMEYPKSLVPGLRQKIDQLRKILEESRHDVFLASLGKV